MADTGWRDKNDMKKKKQGLSKGKASQMTKNLLKPSYNPTIKKPLPKNDPFVFDDSDDPIETEDDVVNLVPPTKTYSTNVAGGRAKSGAARFAANGGNTRKKEGVKSASALLDRVLGPVQGPKKQPVYDGLIPDRNSVDFAQPSRPVPYRGKPNRPSPQSEMGILGGTAAKDPNHDAREKAFQEAQRRQERADGFEQGLRRTQNQRAKTVQEERERRERKNRIEQICKQNEADKEAGKRRDAERREKEKRNAFSYQPKPSSVAEMLRMDDGMTASTFDLGGRSGPPIDLSRGSPSPSPKRRKKEERRKGEMKKGERNASTPLRLPTARSKTPKPAPTTEDNPIELDSSSEEEDVVEVASASPTPTPTPRPSQGSSDGSQSRNVEFINCRLHSQSIIKGGEHRLERVKLLIMDGRIGCLDRGDQQIIKAHPQSIDFVRSFYTNQSLYIIIRGGKALFNKSNPLIAKTFDMSLDHVTLVFCVDKGSNGDLKTTAEYRKMIENNTLIRNLLTSGQYGHYRKEGSERVGEEAHENDVDIRKCLMPFREQLSDLFESQKKKEKNEKSDLVLTYRVGGTLEIMKDDMECLEDGEFLNDKIIDFFLRYSQNRLMGDQKESFHTYTTFFYTKLKKIIGHECDAVSKWSSGNIFEKDFLLIPINSSLHWSLAVVCWPGEVGEEAQDMFDSDEEEMAQPCVVYFDSLGGHLVGRHIYKYLNFMKAKQNGEDTSKGVKQVFNKDTLPIKNAKVPEQENSYDCGCFVLEYAKRLMRTGAARAKEIITEILTSGGKEDWFTAEAANDLRKQIKMVIGKVTAQQATKCP